MNKLLQLKCKDKHKFQILGNRMKKVKIKNVMCGREIKWNILGLSLQKAYCVVPGVFGQGALLLRDTGHIYTSFW